MKYQIDITSTGSNRTKAVRAFRIVGKMSLDKANRIYSLATGSQRTTLVAGVEKATAEHINSGLQSAGVIAEINESSISTPMVCDPQANTHYRWGALRVLQASQP